MVVKSQIESQVKGIDWSNMKHKKKLAQAFMSPQNASLEKINNSCHCNSTGAMYIQQKFILALRRSTQILESIKLLANCRDGKLPAN